MSLKGYCFNAFLDARRDVLAAARIILPHADAGEMSPGAYEEFLKEKHQFGNYKLYDAMTEIRYGLNGSEDMLSMSAETLQAHYNKRFPDQFAHAPKVTAISLRAAARSAVAYDIAAKLRSGALDAGGEDERYIIREKFINIGFRCVEPDVFKGRIYLPSPTTIAAMRELKLKVRFEASNAQVENTYFTLGQNDVKRLIKEILPYYTYKNRPHQFEDRENLVRELLERADKADVDAGLAVNAFIKGDPEHLPIHHRMRGRMAYLEKCRSVLPALCDSDVEPSAQRDRDLEYLRRCFISLTSILQDCDPATDKEPPRLKPLGDAVRECQGMAPRLDTPPGYSPR